jgi:hypothetical protein
MSDRLPVPVYEYVTLMKARSSTWPLWVNSHYHHTGSFTAFDGDRLKAKSKIAARDSPKFRKLWRDALDGGCRDNEHTSARSKNRHADARSSRVHHNAAFASLSQA